MKNLLKNFFGSREKETPVTEKVENVVNIIFEVKDDKFRSMAENVAESFVQFLREYNILEEAYAEKHMDALNRRSEYEKQQGRETDEMRKIRDEFREKKKVLVEPRIESIHWRGDFQKPGRFACINANCTLTFTIKSKAKITAVLETGSDRDINRYKFTIHPSDEGWRIDSFSYSLYQEEKFSNLDL